MAEVEARIEELARWILEAKHPVFFTGAGISTASGLPDFRGPDGVWTRRDKGLGPVEFDWTQARPNQCHMALADLQNMKRLAFLISQNVDNLHLESGIQPELLAELHGNVTKLQCVSCGFKCDNFPDLTQCPICECRLAPSVVDFGDPLPQKDLDEAEFHSGKSDLFVVVGSSMMVYPAAGMPRIALKAGARLVIINQGETPLDQECHLRFQEAILDVLPPAVDRIKQLKHQGY
ncbi:MAG: Sir2 family NAD-dependent protein deacetylase [Dehalococcoidia bacterium]